MRLGEPDLITRIKQIVGSVHIDEKIGKVEGTGLSTVVAEALRRAGLERVASRDGSDVVHIHAGSFSEVFLVATSNRNCILKVYPVDLKLAVADDSDSRFATAVRCFPIAPFYSSTRERIESVRGAVDVELPRVLSEGELENGVHHTLMEKIDGVSFHPRMIRDRDKRRMLSREMGRILGSLHEATRRPTESGKHAERWVSQYGEILHLIADHVPPQVIGPEYNRWVMHRRMNRILARLATIDLGSPVLAHCDFHPSNLVFSDDGSVRGIVDFQLTCFGPAALDFRWLTEIDERSFLEAYGLPLESRDEARWLGIFYEMMWEGLAMVTTRRLTQGRVGRKYWVMYASQFNNLLNLLERERIREGTQFARSLSGRLWRLRSHLRYTLFAR